MKRVRKENDGSDTVFEPEFATGPYRAEIEVASPNELRALKQDGKLVAVRMSGTPKGKSRQYNLIPWEEIVDFYWK